MNTTNRRYDIDWLRVLAIGLLLIYHIAIGFQPWGVFIRFIQNEKPLESLWIAMSMLNTWRIPLLFFVSGMGVCFAMRKRNWKQLLLERSRRILLPFLVGMLLIVPIHQFIWQKYYSQDIHFYPHPGHLWFLGNIFMYVILLSPVFYYLKKNEQGTISRWLRKWLSTPTGMVMITLSFILEVLLVRPALFEGYAFTLHGFLLGLLAFFWGFLIVHSGIEFWQNLRRWKWFLLSGAVILFLIRLIIFQLSAPHYLMAIESICWTFSVFGFGYQYLNRPGKTLQYLSQGAYPIYIIHMVVIFMGSYLIFPMDIPVPFKLILMIVFTATGCFILYDLLIRRIGFLRPLFGLRRNNQPGTGVRFLNLRKTILIFVILTLFISGCALDAPGQYTYRTPVEIQDGLETGTLEAVDLEEQYLKEAVNEIRRGRYKEVHSILIFRDDKLVFEEYFQGHQYQWDGPAHHGSWVNWDRTMLHQIASDTKSITSACIGIAIDRGYIKDVHQSIFHYLPEYQYLNTNGKEEITIEHLLTMTSGLAWDEWSVPLSSPANDIIGLWFNCEDQIACILERPLVYEPGTHFTYCGANMILLGEILRNATEMKIDAFSRRYLFEPLGIDTVDWFIRYPNGVIESAGGLKLTPRAMLKIGVTYLHRGVWEEQRILPEEWVEKSATPYRNNYGIRVPLEDSGKNGYGYSWWVHDFRHRGKKIRMFYAGGWGGQLIMVIPELNAVVVFTGGNYTSKRPAFRIFRKYIEPAFG